MLILRRRRIAASGNIDGRDCDDDPHGRGHTGAIEIANKEVTKGQHPRAVDLAKNIATTQQQEIDDMTDLLTRISRSSTLVGASQPVLCWCHRVIPKSAPRLALIGRQTHPAVRPRRTDGRNGSAGRQPA
jgi:hypothetical protein